MIVKIMEYVFAISATMLIILLILVPGVCMYVASGMLSMISSFVFIIATPFAVIVLTRMFIKHYHENYHYGIKSIGNGYALTTYVGEPYLFIRLLIVTLSGYVFIAMIFALAYHATGASTAGSSFLNNFYFSLIVLSTVGFGDIKPISFGKLLASIQILYGVMYQIGAIAYCVYSMTATSRKSQE